MKSTWIMWKKKRKQEAKQESQQTQCLLFSLPAEIRAIIWSLAIGGNAFCIDRDEFARRSQPKSQSRSLFRRRLDPIPSHKPGHCTLHWNCKDVNSLFCSTLGFPLVPVKGLLSLPLTCRRIHAEALPLLYQQNAITIHNYIRYPTGHREPIWNCGRFDLLTTLETTFMLADIIDIHAYLTPPLFEDEAAWNKAWTAIASLPNLQSLTAYIQRVHWDADTCESQQVDEWYGSQEERILTEPQKVIKPMKRWVLWLSWKELRGNPGSVTKGSRPEDDKEEQEEKMYDYPFEIMRRRPYFAREALEWMIDNRRVMF